MADLRPDVRAYLDRMAAQPRPAMTAELLAQLRLIPPEALAQMMAGLDAPVGELARREDFTCPGPGGDIALRLYDVRAERAAGGAVMVFYQGGGFVVGGIGTHEAMAAEIARRLDLPVVSVEYRLAPEHPWPAAPDDGEAAARWVAEHGADLGLTPDALILCGDSAGGNLAAITAIALRDDPAALPVAAQLLIYPMADASRHHPSREEFAQGFGLDASDMALFDQHFRGDKQSWRHSPLLAELAGLPPALVVAAGFDPLRDEGRAYAAKLIAAGVDTIYHEAAGTIHGFASYRGAIPSANADLARVLDLAAVLIARTAA